MQAKLQDLESKLVAANAAYHNNQAVISDDEYDALIYELASFDPHHSLLQTVGAEPTSEWTKEKHLYPLGSLNKVNSGQDMTDWLTKIALGKPVVVVEKLDGISIGCQYNDGKLTKALLRGAGIAGENILTNALRMQGIVREIPGFTGVLRGEIVLTKTNHQRYFPGYANPRNAASGIARNLEGQGCEHLTLMFYQVLGAKFAQEVDYFAFLKQHGCIVPNYQLCTAAQSVIDLWTEYQKSKRENLDYEIDGLVVSINDVPFQMSLGETHLRSKGKLAFKFANQFVSTTVKRIEWTVGNTGRITPVCWFEPVNLLGSTIEKASAYNAAYVSKLGLGTGAEVLVCKAGEIIPRVERVLKPAIKVALVPGICPSCEAPIETDGEYLVCPNSDGCMAQRIGAIKTWINTLDVLEWGTTLIERLVTTGLVTNVVDLYKLSLDDLCSLERMGTKSAQKCLDTLWASTELDLPTFIGGLNIPLIGATTVQMLVDAGFDDLDKLLEASLDALKNVKGLGEVKATALYGGLRERRALIDDLLKHGIKLSDGDQYMATEAQSAKLQDMRICITGSTDVKRSDLIKIIEANGGEFCSSVSKSTTHLMLADPSKVSTKTKNATKLGVKIISEVDFFQILE